MSDNNVDRRVVEMEFRNGNFERNANQSINTLNKLDKSLNINGDGAAKSLHGISAAMAALPIPGLASGIETVSAKFSALQVVGVTALANITNSAVNAGKRIVSALTIDPVYSGLSEYELKMDSTRVIMSSTGESIETVNKYLEELNEYSDRTIYSFADMTNNIGKFTNAGVKLKDAVMAIKGVSNEAAVSGANANEASRAMYNFAQALSQGSVKLIDWKSIENANMATMEFKQQLIDTAVEFGTLTKDGDKYVSTTVDLNGKVSDAFDSTQMFNESLSHQWMTTDVLIKTLGKYADETTDIGKKSYKAAEEVTTLSKMVDTLKETAQSGWARTWEIFFGDIETAKKLFTPLTEAISGIIQKYDDFRNNLLEGALSKSPLGQLSEKLSSLKGDTESNAKGVTKSLVEMQDVVNRVWRGDYGVMQERWNLLDSEGYDSKVVQSLVNLGYQYSLSVDDVNAAYKKYGKAAPAVIKATDGLKTSIEDLNDEQLKNAGLTDDEIKQYRELQKQSKETGKSIGELISNMDGLNGRELLINGLKNVGESLMNTFGALKDAWVDAFPPPTSTQLYNLIDGFNKFTERIKITEEKAAKLERIFKGVFAVVDLVATVIGGPLKIAFKIVTKVLSYFNLDILDVVAGVADAIVVFRDWVESLIDFDAVAESIGKAIEYVAGAVTSWWDGFKNAPNKFKYVADSMKTIASSVANTISKWFDDLANSDTIVGHIIQGFCNGFTSGIQSVITAVADFVNCIVTTVKTMLGIHSPSTVFFDIGKNIIEGLFNGLSWFVGKVTDFARDSVKDVVGIFDSVPWDTIFMGAGLTSTIVVARRLSKAAEAMTSPLGSLSDCIETVEKTIKNLGKSLKGYINAKKFAEYGNAFKSFAAGMLLIAASLWVLSGVDADSMKRSIVAMSAMGALIIVLAFVFSKLQGIKPLSVLGVIIGLSLLLTKMAMVLVICSLLSPNKAKQGILCVTALTALIGVLMGLMKLFSVKQAYMGSKLMMSISKVFIAMTVAMRVVGGMKDDAFAKGLMAVTAFSLLIVGLMAATKLITDKDVAKAAASFGSIGLCLALMAVAVKIAGSMSIKEATTGTAVIAAMVILVALLMAATRLFTSKNKKIGSTMLALSLSLIAMAVAVKIAGSMDKDSVRNGLGVIVCLCAVITALMIAVKLFGSDKKVGSTILAMSVAIGILALVCILMGKVDPHQMGQGLAAVAILGAILSLLIKSARGVEKCASSIVAIAVAVGIIALVATLLGNVPAEQLAKGVAAVSVMMISLSFVFKSAKKISKNMGSIIAVSAAIAVMAAAVWLLSTIEAEPAIRSTACLVTLMTDFALCMKIVSKTGTVNKKSLIAIGEMALVAAALSGLIILLSQCANPDAALQTTTCLLALLPDFSACMLILGKTKGVKKKTMVAVAEMTAVATALSGLVILLSQCANPDAALQTSAALAILLSDLAGATFVLSKSKGITNKTLATIGILTAIMAAVAGILILCEELDVQPSIATATAISELMAALTGATAVICLIKGADPGAALEVLAVMGLVIAAVAAVIAALAGIGAAVDAITGEPGSFERFMQSGVDLLAMLGQAIGLFVGELIGGIVGGIADGAVAKLPEVGKNLTKFMENCAGFIDQASKIPSNVSSNVSNLAGALLSITATNLLSSFMDFFVGEQSMQKFSDGLVALGGALHNFYESVKTLDDAAVKQCGICAGVCAKLADMATHIPREGGLWGDIFGNNSLKEWAPGLTVLGENLVSFATSIRSLTDADLSHMESASATVEVIAGMAEKIPNEGGLWASIFGDNALSTWAPELPILGENLTAFANSISGITSTDAKNMETMTGVAKGLADMANAIPNEGLSFASVFVGDNSLAMWAPELSTLGTHLKNFAVSLRGIATSDTTKMAVVTAITKTLVDMSSQIPDEGGIVSWFTGDNSIDKWGAKLPDFGTQLKGFTESVRGIGSADDATKAAAVASALADGTKNIPSTGGLAALFAGEQDLSKWGSALPEFGKGVKGFADNVEGIKDVDNLTAITNIAETLAGISDYAPKVGGVVNAFTGTTDIQALGDGFGAIGDGLYKFATSVNGNSSDTKQALDFTSANMDSAVRIVKTLSEIYDTLSADNLFEALAGLISGGNVDKFVSSLGALGTSTGQFIVSYFATGAGAYSGQDGKVDQVNSIIDCIKNITSVIADDMNSDKIFNSSIALEDFTGSVQYFFSNMNKIIGETDGQLIRRLSSAADVLNDWIRDFDAPKASSCATSIGQLNDSIKAFEGIEVKEVDKFVESINKLAEAGSADTNAFDSLYKGMTDVGVKMVNSMSTGIKDNWAVLRNGITSAAKTSREKMSGAISSFKAIGRKIISEISNAANTNWNFLYLGISSAVTQSQIKMNSSFYSSFKTIGSQFMQGLADGITAKEDVVATAATTVAQAAVDATKRTLDVHSPSRVMYSIGEYTGMGFAKGLKEYETASFYAGENVSQRAVDGMAVCLNQVQTLLDDENLEWTPTISPVLDLTGVQNGAKQIDNMLNSGAHVSTALASNISVNSSGSDGGMSNTDIVRAINDLSNRIDALPHNTYNVNGVTYDDGSNISDAVAQLVDAIQLKRRT